MEYQESPETPLRRRTALVLCRGKPKQEGLATRLLRSELGMEVFCPKIRFKRARSTGVAWVSEAMFPGYLFAGFIYPELHRLLPR